MKTPLKSYASRLRLALLTLATISIIQYAQGQTPIDWANVGSDYATGANWIGGAAPADSTTANIAQFGAQGAGPVNPVLAAARSVRGVAFLSGAYGYTFSGAILTIGTSGIVRFCD